MSESNKIADLCYTAGFMFDRLADISMQIHDLEKGGIEKSITIEEIEQNVLKFNKELDDIPRLRPITRTYVPRRNTRPLESYRPGNPYCQVPYSYRLVSPSNMPSSARTFSIRNDQTPATQISRKHTTNEEQTENQSESKQQMRGIKWVAASGEDVQKSGLNPANLAKASGTSRSTKRRTYKKVVPPRQSSQITNHNCGNYLIAPKIEPLSPVRTNRPFSATNSPTSGQPCKAFNEDEAILNSLLALLNENNEANGGVLNVSNSSR